MTSTSNVADLASQMRRGEQRKSGLGRRLTIIGVAVPAMVVSAAAAMIQLGFGDEAFMAPLLVGPAESIILLALVAGFTFLVANAVFAVSDRASVRTYGLVAANGATAAQLRQLAVRRSLAPGLWGLAIGGLAGLVVGTVIMWLFDAVQPGWLLAGYTMAMVAFFLVPMLIGVWLGALLPARQVARRSITAALGGRDLPSQPKPAPLAGPSPTATPSRSTPSADKPRAGLAILAVSLAATIVLGLTFNHSGALVWAPDWLRSRLFQVAESYPVYLGLTLSTIGVVVGLVMVLPWMFKRLADSVDAGPAWLRLGLGNLARNRGRAGVAAGSLLVLAAAAVMAVAGIESDLDVRPPSADPRYIEVNGTRPAVVEAVTEALAADTEANSFIVTRVQTAQLNFLVSERDAYRQWAQRPAAVLNDTLITALNLDDAALEAADGGAVLKNTAHVASDPTASINGEDTPLPVHNINHGEGGELTFAYLVSQNLADDMFTPVPGLYTLFVTEQPITGETRDRLRNIGAEYQQGIGFSGPGAGITARQVQWILIAVAALLALVVGWVSTASVRISEAKTRATMGDLGMRPTHRLSMLAAEVGVQQTLAGVLGAGLGVVLFRLVTLGDPSVPGLIVPWLAIAIFALAVPLATVVLVAATGLARSASS